MGAMSLDQEGPVSRTHAPVPWTLRDTWVGIGLALLTGVLSGGALGLLPETRLRNASALTVTEVALLVPVLAILLWRRAGWRNLGFRSFTGESFALGCGLMVVAYAATIVHNMVLLMLGINTQAQSILELLKAMGSPWGLALGGILVGPLAEEIVFRGFFFQGLRQAYGSNRALLISSLVFGAMHLQLVALIPTFLLGLALAYVYDRADSIWPCTLLHLSINLIGICMVLAMAGLPKSL